MSAGKLSHGIYIAPSSTSQLSLKLELRIPVLWAQAVCKENIHYLVKMTNILKASKEEN